MPTQHGSKAYKGHFPEVDASAIAICRAAGALIYGKAVGHSCAPENHADRVAYDRIRGDASGASDSERMGPEAHAGRQLVWLSRCRR